VKGGLLLDVVVSKGTTILELLAGKQLTSPRGLWFCRCLRRIILPSKGALIWALFNTWVGYKPLKEQFPSLFNIVHYSHDTVVNVMNQNPLNISFRRAVAGDKLTSWHNLIAILTTTFTRER
jgi:hypothetical protein